MDPIKVEAEYGHDVIQLEVGGGINITYDFHLKANDPRLPDNPTGEARREMVREIREYLSTSKNVFKLIL